MTFQSSRLNELAAPRLSVIVPTYNERSNIGPLIERLAEVLVDISWEVIVVDDDSPDGTADAVSQIARSDYRVRCLRRVGRRGLSSAVVEGVMAASSEIVAVIDADFQHDETRLPIMYEAINDRDADLVIGTRYSEGGGVCAEADRFPVPGGPGCCDCNGYGVQLRGQ
jgi:dolichol-phosphate mannosyltransferase